MVSVCKTAHCCTQSRQALGIGFYPECGILDIVWEKGHCPAQAQNKPHGLPEASLRALAVCVAVQMVGDEHLHVADWTGQTWESRSSQSLNCD